MRSLDFDFANFSDDHGNLGRPVPSGQIFVPGKVWRVGDTIRWRMDHNTKLKEVSRSMLNQFVSLAARGASDYF